MSTTFGDSSGILSSGQRGRKQTITLDEAGGTVYGDALELRGSARGGSDRLTGGDGAALNQLFGDADLLRIGAAGGNDVLTGGADAGLNELFGDAYRMNDSDPSPSSRVLTKGGNDTLTGGANSVNNLYGDAYEMNGSAAGGNDKLTGGDNSENQLFGDAYVMNDASRGGNDVLIGGDDNTSYLYGDAYELNDASRGGNDTLISGTGSDHMWGDAYLVGADTETGADSFGFGPDSGLDYVYDFRQSDHDEIDVSAYGFNDISDLTITAINGGVDTEIDFGGGNSAILYGVDAALLTAADFRFA